MTLNQSTGVMCKTSEDEKRLGARLKLKPWGPRTRSLSASKAFQALFKPESTQQTIHTEMSKLAKVFGVVYLADIY